MSIESVILSHLPNSVSEGVERLKASPLGGRLASGAFWSISGAVISRILMLLANIIVARILTCEIYGELGIIRSTVNMFVIFAGFGLGLTATKHVAEFKATDPSRASRIMAISGLFTMGIGGLIAIIVIVFAPWLSVHTINAPHLTTELRIGAVILLISALNGAQTGSLAGLEAFKTIAIVNIFVGILSFPIFVCGAYFGGLQGTVLALGANISNSQ